MLACEVEGGGRITLKCSALNHGGTETTESVLRDLRVSVVKFQARHSQILEPILPLACEVEGGGRITLKCSALNHGGTETTESVLRDLRVSVVKFQARHSQILKPILPLACEVEGRGRII